MEDHRPMPTPSGTAAAPAPVIDADGHFSEPASLWADYLPEKYRAMGPQFVLDSMGQTRLVIGGKTLPRYPSVPLPRHRDARRDVVDPDAERAGWDPH
jgi:hypothetical protein